MRNALGRSQFVGVPRGFASWRGAGFSPPASLVTFTVDPVIASISLPLVVSTPRGKIVVDSLPSDFLLGVNTAAGKIVVTGIPT